MVDSYTKKCVAVFFVFLVLFVALLFTDQSMFIPTESIFTETVIDNNSGRCYDDIKVLKRFEK